MNQPQINDRLILREKPTGIKSIMYQNWKELLFLHWEYDVSEIQSLLPPGLNVDTFNGKAYIGISPFFMRRVRPKFLPSLPGLSNFLELNVRTYVYDKNGTAGIWFFSLDASQLVAVELAKRIFKLPYYYANMKAEKNNSSGEINFFSQRYDSEKFGSSFIFKIEGEPFYAESGTIEFFLIERYVMFTYDEENKTLYRGRIHHLPHQLLKVKVIKWDNNLFELNNLTTPKTAPIHSITSIGVKVEIYPLEKII